MTARRIAQALGLAVLGFAGVYVFVYLYRWEWNRALFCLGLFIAVEVAMAMSAVIGRLNRLGRQLEARQSNQVDPIVLARISEAAPPPSRPFAWLVPEDGTTINIFVPVLMGAGVVLSGLAWVVERLGSATARPVMERDLAARLTGLALPDALVPPRTAAANSRYHPGSCVPAP
jgi:hypothetical protein